MLIELQEPFKSVWNKGYLVNDVDGRKRVVLHNSKNHRWNEVCALSNVRASWLYSTN